jgi:hypothetical protein
VVASLLAIGLASSSIAATDGQFRATCRSGRTLFHDGPVRAFHVSFYDAVHRGEEQELLACVVGSAKPVVIYDPGPFNYVQGRGFQIIGHRLGFVAYDQGFANGSEVDVGWLDLQTRTVKFGLLNAGVNAGPHDPLLPADQIGYTFAADGTTAVIAGRSCQVVAVLPVRRKPFEQVYGLGPPVVLYTASAGGLNPASIQVNATAVTWQTITGTAGSAPLSGSPADTTSRTGGC